MYTYHYQIAGLEILVTIPFPIRILDSAREFIVDTDSFEPDHLKTDLYFEYKEVKEIKAPLETGEKISFKKYIETPETREVYFLPLHGELPYACVSWDLRHPKRILCTYVSGEEYRLNYSMSLCDMIGIETILLKHNGLLLHSSFLRLEGRGILFSGPSGIGKSTQAELWRKYRGGEIINGDRAGLRRTAEGWTAYGLPYAGSSKIYRNESAPVSVIIMLEKGSENQIERLDASKAFRRIYPQVTTHQWDPEFVEKNTDNILSLITDVPVYLLTCRPEEDAIKLVENIL